MRPPDWQSDDGAIQLYCGDCLELLPELEPGSVDAVVTDPPYPGREDLFDTDSLQLADYYMSEWPGVIFWPTMPAPLREPDAIHIWWKAVPIHPHSVTGNVAGHHYERILAYGLGGRCEVYRVAAVMPNFSACAGELQPHPTQKPLSLMLRLISHTKGTVLDPFLGSGTTAVACVKLGRKCIGIEIEKTYFDIAVRRVKAAIVQGPDDALFRQADKPVQLPLSGTETS